MNRPTPHHMSDTFTPILLAWFAENGRTHLPWLESKNPYHIWLSEVILQQTRVEQGTPYFLKFREKYPTIFDLAAALDDDVMKTWEGLGYYSRARNMLSAARFVVSDLGGVFPNTYPEIRALRGVGPYTAAAIASFAFGLPYAVVDGNVYRVLARVFGIESPTDETTTKKDIAALAQSLLPTSNVADFNQAMMDFGATVCTPAAPKCPTCPLQNTCFAYAHQAQSRLPVRAKKQPKRTRLLTYYVARWQGFVWLHHRTAKDIWQGLYDFPSIETTENDPIAFDFPKHRVADTQGPFKQQLTHQTIIAHFVSLDLETAWLNPPENCLKIAEKDLRKYAFPKIVDMFLKLAQTSVLVTC